MDNLRNPMISRSAALEAAKRLKCMASKLEDDTVLQRIVLEANRTIAHSVGLADGFDDVEFGVVTASNQRLIN